MTATAVEYNEKLVEELLNRRADLKAKVTEIEKDIKDINDQLMVELKKAPDETITIGNQVPKISRQTRYEYDWESIKTKIGLVNWKKIINEVPDPGKLAKVIDIQTVSQYINEVPAKAPFVRVDKVKKEDA